MESFDDVFKEKFPDLVEAISCGDLIAKNYKVAIKEGFDLGQQSKQQEVDELQKRIDALEKSEFKLAKVKSILENHMQTKLLESIVVKRLINFVIKGKNHES